MRANSTTYLTEVVRGDRLRRRHHPRHHLLRNALHVVLPVALRGGAVRPARHVVPVPVVVFVVVLVVTAVVHSKLVVCRPYISLLVLPAEDVS